MRRVLILALALVMLCGCGASDGEARQLGRSVLFTRTATDEEAFRQSLELQESAEMRLEDEVVPLAALPLEEAEPEEGWLLVRYVKGEDGTAEPQLYWVWTAEERWSQESLPCAGAAWHPVIPAE